MLTLRAPTGDSMSERQLSDSEPEVEYDLGKRISLIGTDVESIQIELV